MIFAAKIKFSKSIGNHFSTLPATVCDRYEVPTTAGEPARVLRALRLGVWRAKYRDVACKNEHSTSASASLVELRAKSTRAKEQKEHQKSTRAERTEASSGEQKEQSASELGGLAYV